MRTAINPLTGNELHDSFNKVLTFGLSEAESKVLSEFIPEGISIIPCDNDFDLLVTTPCNCIVFAPSKMDEWQISELNCIYEDETRILMLSTETKKRGFQFQTHKIDLSKSPSLSLKRLRRFLSSFQQPCFSNTDGYMLNDGFVLVDVETTGIAPEEDELILVSAVRVANFEIVASSQVLVKPNKAIPTEIEELTEITNKMVNSAESAKDAVANLINKIGLDVRVAYNARFVEAFLRPVFSELGYEMDNKPQLELQQLLMKFYANKVFSKSRRLVAYASALGIDLTRTPLYEQEALVLATVLREIRQEYEIRSVSGLKRMY